MDYTKLGLAAAESEDLTQNKSFEREIPRAGVALLRLKDYIELGRHESSNPAHKPAEKAMLVFELNHPDHMVEIDGKKVPGQITVRLNKGSTSKSGYRKLFNCMNIACGGGKQHFVQMIGQAFLGEIYHNVVGEGDKKNTYVNLDLDGAWSLKEPSQLDVINNTKTPINIRELEGTPKVFLWENTSISDEDIKEMWKSIFIEGTRDVEDAATKKVKQVSKNWIQETLLANIDWEGSRTQALVQEQVNLDEPAVTETKEAPLAALAQSAGNDLPSLDN